MNSEWKEYTVQELIDLDMLDEPLDGNHGSIHPKASDYVDEGVPFIMANNLINGVVDLDGCVFISEEQAKTLRKGFAKPGDVLLTHKATIGRTAIVPDRYETIILTPQVTYYRVKRGIDNRYLKYYFDSPDFQTTLNNWAGSGSTRAYLGITAQHKLPVILPPYSEQQKIADILEVLDRKIQLNTEINKNLQEQAQTIYREMFVNAKNNQRQTCRAEEYFDIAIGKTPPRKEHQWFTTDPSDVTWVSISDMGNCDTFIRRSSEQLTQKAVDKFNIRVIPSNTVLLSFKLTVGRIAISYGEMTTNEAIAHFKTDKAFINEYLYCYLKDFNYQTLGSTSSIATAVNSKIIKAMPFIIPTDDEISRFHTIVDPIFKQILNNQLENDSLAEMRGALLPRLMSGELDVSNIDL